MNKGSEKLIPILWVAFFLSVVTYFAVLVFMHGGLGQLEHLDYDRMFLFDNPLALSLYVLSVLAIGASRVISGFVVSPSPQRKALAGFIIKLAILESICLYGFLLGLILKDIQAALPLFTLGLVGIFLVNPFTRLEDVKPSSPTTMT